MPNHCENDLYIDGPKEKVDALFKLMGLDKDKPEFDCNAVIPYPEKFRDMDAEARVFSWNSPLSKEEQEAARAAYMKKWGTTSDGYNSGGYEWCINNWGTKWGAYDVWVYTHELRGLCVTFYSAWSPPSPVIEKLVDMFPELRIEHEYFECGAGYCGGLIAYPHDEDYPDDSRVNTWQGTYSGSRGG